MAKNILSKLKESFISIFPIVAIVLVLGLTVSPLSSYDIIKFIISAILLIVGMSFFTVGADSAMFTMGSSVGGNLSKSRKIVSFILISFCIGFIVTMAEPDLSVLASQVISLNKWLFICIVALGFGICLALFVLSIIFQIKVKYLLIASYLIVFVLAIFVPEAYLPISIDAGAVTNGPISVPFVLAFGMGISAVRSGKHEEEDNFGLIALTSVGPLITTMLMCILVGKNPETSQAIITETQTGTALQMFNEFGVEFLSNILNILVVLIPIIIFFFVYNYFFLKYPKTQIIKIIIGLVYTYLGIVVFLTGIMTGFLPVASVLGFNIATSNVSWLLIPIAALIGLTTSLVEPAVHVTNKKVEEMTQGRISKKVMMIAICIGTSISLVISILRVLFNINFIYLIIPIYAVCIILTFFCPAIFTSIAFDSGGVASGAMSTGFVLPFVMGVAQANGVDIMFGGFGTIAFIAAMPIFTILILGVTYNIIYKLKTPKEKRKRKKPVEIIEFDLGEE